MNPMLAENGLPEVVMPSCPIRKVLKDQKALVTGATSGIGKGIAIALAHAGADVVINYRSNPESAEQVVKEAMHCGSRVYAHQADVSKEDQVQAMFGKMFDEFGTIDILVNNAGLQQDAPFDQMTLAQWNTVLGINLTGQFLCAREAVREFKRRGVKGHPKVVNLEAKYNTKEVWARSCTRTRTTMWAATPSSTGPLSSASARKTSASCGITAASRRPGRSVMTTSNRITPKPNGCTTFMVCGARIQRSRRPVPRIRTRRSVMKSGSSTSRTTSPGSA